MIDSRSSEVQEILDNSFAADLTLPWVGVPGDTALRAEIPARYLKSGWSFLSLTVATDDDMTTTLGRLAEERRYIQTLGDRCVLVESVSDIRRAKSEGKLALGLHFQGTLPLERNINMIAVYYKLGVRHMLMAYNQKNFVADGCHELNDGGLSRFGHDVVAEMNRVGMIVDIAHTGYKSSMEALEASKSPVIVSHGNIQVLCNHPRCYTDDQIRAVAKSGGVMGLTGLGIFIGGNDASTEAFVRQIEYVINLVGVDHVGFGLDYVYDMPALERHAANFSSKWPTDGGYTTQGIQQVEPERLPAIVEALLARGYSSSDISKIIGGNWLRVFEQVWK